MPEEDEHLIGTSVAKTVLNLERQKSQSPSFHQRSYEPAVDFKFCHRDESIAWGDQRRAPPRSSNTSDLRSSLAAARPFHARLLHGTGPYWPFITKPSASKAIARTFATLLSWWKESAMSYQYPPPLPSSGSEMNMSHPGYAPNYGAPAPVPSPMDPRTQEQTLKERKESFSQASLKLKRSMSTPNVRPQQANTSDPSQSGLAGDKKRNKLGYHRTSVACDRQGHCRRRKIRCIASPAIGESRCINCIRLKKECSFFPVDQPPLPQATEPRPKAPSRASSGPKVASASSSPAMAAGQSLDVSQRQQYRPGVMHTAPGMAPPPIQPSAIENLAPEATSKSRRLPESRQLADGRNAVSSGMASSSRAFGFPNQPVAWMSPEVSPSSTTQPNDHHETWKSYTEQSPITPSFSPYTSQAPPSASWGNADSNAPGDMGYSSFAPGSSMTYPRNTPLPPQYPVMPQQNRQVGRKSSTMSEEVYPTQIATQFPAIDPHNASLSAGAIPPAGYGSWVQPPYTYARQNEDYQGWTYEENEGN
ncbi:fungal Zn binuclear cluster domain containing protein [Colletotrichum tofieldiae]|uniref:Fungal Zn binuclear cluster domain containing protein n=1 Tax=Colletotrichum tofieldiae TaxID=708197 RepID=A0A166UFR5_9PEZI|nr:fungal Zn binuclear cluster domain containing protein [Colletotrichum tofieldiae]